MLIYSRTQRYIKVINNNNVVGLDVRLRVGYVSGETEGSTCETDSVRRMRHEESSGVFFFVIEVDKPKPLKKKSFVLVR